MRAARLLSSILVLGCGAATSAPASPEAPEERVWVVAPHPDDEVLMAGASILDAAARGVAIEVVVMTNGDLSCERDGWRRQDETIAALAMLGVDEAHVHFLGYPDGWLDALARAPIGPFPRAAADGTCGTGDRTYGRRGAEHADVHSARTGEAATFTEANVLDDLGALLEALPPTTIHLPHAIDTHPDHAATYELVRRALGRVEVPLPTLVRHVVHVGGCWPAMIGTACTPPSPALAATALPPLPALPAYAPDVVRPVAAATVTRWRDAIGCYVSQLEQPVGSDWLSTFARTTEPGWSQTLVRDGDEVVPRVEESGSIGPEWTAPIVASARLRSGRALTLGDDGYVLLRSAAEIALTRADRTLAGVALPEASDVETLSIRVVPVRDGHVELEVLREGRFLAGAVDPEGIVRGTAPRTDGDEGEATIVPMRSAVDEATDAR